MDVCLLGGGGGRAFCTFDVVATAVSVCFFYLIFFYSKNGSIGSSALRCRTSFVVVSLIFYSLEAFTSKPSIRGGRFLLAASSFFFFYQVHETGTPDTNTAPVYETR